MKYLKTVYIWLRNLLSIIGLCLILVSYICFFTDVPNSLFKSISIQSTPKNADVIIVLGAGVTINGWPDRFSSERAVKGIILYKQKFAPKIIFSGGWDHDGYIAAAKAMAKMAKDLGVNESDIFIEDKSHNTYENLLFSSQLMKKHNMQSAIVVTSESHLKRAYLIAKTLKLKVYPAGAEEELIRPQLSYRSKIHNFNILYQVLYEKLGIWKYRSNGWIKS